LGNWQGNWRHRSAVLLALLVGFYAGSNLTAYFVIVFPGGRPALVLALVILLEYSVPKFNFVAVFAVYAHKDEENRNCSI
jgi:hypothetical protein